MFKIFLSLNFLFAFTACCPNGTIPGLTKDVCYYFSSFYPTFPPLDSLQAFDYPDWICQNYGGHLVSILDAFESVFVLDHARHYFGERTLFWIGGIKNLATLYSNYSSPWKWLDYNKFTYTNWAVGEPKIYSDYVGCDAIFNNNQILGIVVNGLDGKWNSVRYPDNESYPYVYKVPPNPPPYCSGLKIDNWCGTEIGLCIRQSQENCTNCKHVPPCKSWNMSTGNPCYKGTGKASSWPSSIHSYVEASILYEQAIENAREYFCFGGGQYNHSRNFVGLRYNRTIDAWAWIDGTPVDWINWSPGYLKEPEKFGECVYFNMNITSPNEFVNTYCYGEYNQTVDDFDNSLFCTYTN